MNTQTFRFECGYGKTFKAIDGGDWNGFRAVLLPASERDSFLAACDDESGFESAVYDHATGALRLTGLGCDEDVIDLSVVDGLSDEGVYNLSGYCIVAD